MKQKNFLKNDLFIEDEDFDEFIYRPTALSKHLKNKVKELYLSKVYPVKTSFWKRLLFQLNMFIYLKISHPSAFKILKKIENLITLKTDSYSLEKLEKIFLEVQNLLIKNNLSLSIFYLRNRIKIESNLFHAPLTFEEQSKFFLKMIPLDSSYEERFKKKFGYYSINNYELAARRFSEYSATEILELAKFTANLEIIAEKPDLNILEQFILNPVSGQEIYSNILIIRDLAKNILVKIISLLRKRFLEIAKIHQIPNPFERQWKELLELSHKE